MHIEDIAANALEVAVRWKQIRDLEALIEALPDNESSKQLRAAYQQCIEWKRKCIADREQIILTQWATYKRGG